MSKVLSILSGSKDPEVPTLLQVANADNDMIKNVNAAEVKDKVTARKD